MANGEVECNADKLATGQVEDKTEKPATDKGECNAGEGATGNDEDNAEELAKGQGKNIDDDLSAGQGNDVNAVDNSFEIDVGQNMNVSPECAGCVAKDMKYKDLMKVYLKLTHRYTQLDEKYAHLLQLKTNTNEPEPDSTVLSNKDVFTPNEVKYLHAMPLDKKTDSTFVLKCLEFSYKDNLSVMKFKTLKGRPESVQYNDNGEIEQHSKKDPLTPKKVQRIKELFIDRVSKCKIDATAFGERIKDANVNKLFATGILNIAKKNFKN